MRLFIMGLSVLISASAVHAAPVAFSFGGFVLTVTDTHGVLDGSIVPMTRISGHVEYDTVGADIFGSDSTISLFFQNPPVGQIRVDIGTYTLEIPTGIPARFSVLDDWRFAGVGSPIDGFDWRMEGDTFPATASSHVIAMLFTLETTDTSVFSTDALPTGPLDLADFPNPNTTRFSITGCLASELSGSFCVPTESIQIFGTIDTLPEPAPMGQALCALTALMALAGIRRRRRLDPRQLLLPVQR